MVEGFSTIFCSFRYHRIIIQTSRKHVVVSVCVLHPVQTKWRRKEKGRGKPRGPRYIPVLVEATTALLGQMLGPHVDEGTQTEGSLDVADGTDHNHGRGLQNGDSLDHLLLVDLCKEGENKAIKIMLCNSLNSIY